MASLNFDASNIDTTSHFDALPAGDYEAMVTSSEMKTTKDGTGQYLELRLEIQSGHAQGRSLFDRLNLQNRNPKAVEIAQKQLAQLCHATGVLQVTDSQHLHNRPVVMKVTPSRRRTRWHPSLRRVFFKYRFIRGTTGRISGLTPSVGYRQANTATAG